MKKFSLITAVLLLSCAWAVAQTSPSSTEPSSSQPSTQSPSTQSPSSTSPSTQSPSTTSPTAQQPDTSTTGNASSNGSATSGNDKGNAIEGCLSGSAGSYTLTDASGTTYQLAGDTSKLSDHVGHQVKIWGDNSSSASASATGSSTSSTAAQTFNVKRVKMVSSNCSTK